MSILIWIIFGALVGWIASIVMHTKGGLIRNIIVGLIGSVLGGFIASLFGIGSVTTFTIEGFLIALGGAVLLIWIVKRFI
ncbi:MAG: GlsB/YeaQ/YmgE family stress response membrane protein [Bacillota bacterium]